jgi:hypothetical protein
MSNECQISNLELRHLAFGFELGALTFGIAS